MTAPHFFVEGARALDAGTRISLSKEDSRHALKALRLRLGEAVTVADDEGAVATASVVGEDDGRAVVQIESVRRVVRRGGLVSIALAPPKGDRLAWAVQKQGELGVDELVLVPTARTVREWTGDRADRALDRLRSVAREAAMQSRRPFVMRILAGATLQESLAVKATVVMLWEGAETPINQVLADDDRPVRLVVGPEGGFTDEEVEAAREAGAHLAGLGPGILRTETAAVVGATLALARRGRLG